MDQLLFDGLAKCRRHPRLLALAALGIAAAGAPAVGIAQEEDEVRARMEYDRIRLYSGPVGNLAALLQRARLEKLAMPPAGALPTALTTTTWRALGPDRVRSGSAFTAGRVSAVAIHPDDPDVIYAGGAQGGVWKSTDAGDSWTPLTDQECSLAMGHIAIDPEDPDIIYAGTGEQHFSGDSYYGCGVLRSLDGGDTWEQFGADVFVDSRRGEGSGGARIARVVIDRATAGSTDTTIVLAASTYGLYRSTNSGQDWDRVVSGIATDVLAHPDEDSVFYAAVHGTEVYRSTDTGESWDEVSEGMSFSNARRINLAISHSDPDILYASFQTGDAEGRGLRMYRTDDGAEEWEKLDATGADCGYQCWYDMTIAVDPEDPETVYFGAVVMQRSTDGGDTFSRHHNGIYVDEHYLVFDTVSDPEALYLANDGGVYRTTNGGNSWTSLATDLAVAQYYRGISLHPSDAGVTLGGTQDQGTQRSSAGTGVWNKVMGGDGGYTAFDVEDPATWYGETQWVAGTYGGPRKNGNLAMTGIDRSERGLFIPPLVMDPIDSRRLYFGVRSLYRTDNSAGRWHRIYRAPEDKVVSAIGLTPSDENTVYAALRYGQVVVTRDGGRTWQESGSGLPNRFIGDVAVHPDKPEEAYAVAGGFNNGHVFHTTDGGRSWRDRTGNLPDHPVNAIIYDPADLEGVFIGTDLGVFHSAGGGDDWTRLDDKLPNAAVFDLATWPGTSRLVAATHGRGMFEIPVDVPLTLRTRPASFTDTIMEGDTTVLTGEVIVAPSGRNDHAASWEATSDVSWVTVTDPAGTGRGRFQYRVSGEALDAGDHRTAIEVTLAGVADPFEIPVALTSLLPSHLELGPAGPRVKMLVGSTEPEADSVAVLFSGPRKNTKWKASHAGGDRLELVRASGAGEGAVTWTVDPTGLPVGLYVDTIVVEANRATGSPAEFVDTFAVQPPLGIEEERETRGYGVAGWSPAPSDSAFSGLMGFGEDSARWSAGASASGWLVIERAEGGYREHIVWKRDADGLEVGVYEDTITIRVQGHPGLVGLIVDRFEVVDPIEVEDAALHLLGGDRLSAGQIGLLDWFGNRDGTLNAGDVLRWLDHCAAGKPGSGCGAGSGSDPERSRDDPVLGAKGIRRVP